MRLSPNLLWLPVLALCGCASQVVEPPPPPPSEPVAHAPPAVDPEDREIERLLQHIDISLGSAVRNLRRLAEDPAAVGAHRALVEDRRTVHAARGRLTALGQRLPTVRLDFHPLQRDAVAGEHRPAAVVRLESAGERPLHVHAAALVGADAAIVRRDDCSGKTLAPGDDCEIELAFDPAAAWVSEARLQLVHDGEQDRAMVPLAFVADIVLSGMPQESTGPPPGEPDGGPETTVGTSPEDGAGVVDVAATLNIVREASSAATIVAQDAAYQAGRAAEAAAGTLEAAEAAETAAADARELAESATDDGAFDAAAMLAAGAQSAIAVTQERLNEVRERLADAETSDADAEAGLTRARDELTASGAALDRQERRFTAAQEQLDTALAQLEDARDRLAVAQSQIDDAEAELANAAASLEEAQADIEHARKEYARDAVPPPGGPEPFSTPGGDGGIVGAAVTVALAVLGTLLLALIVAAALRVAQPSPFQYKVFNGVLAAGVALIVTSIVRATGLARVAAELAESSVGADGTLASLAAQGGAALLTFALVYAVRPMHQREPADASETWSPPGAALAAARSIFISYRRSDSADNVDRIYRRLTECYGKEAVFKDLEDITLGDDFRETLAAALAECQLVLAVIGPEWAGEDEARSLRRIDDPRDYVCLEIQTALGRKLPVIPLLVRGASMPSREQLPERVAELAFRNGMEVRPDPHFDNDIRILIDNIDKILARRR